VTPGAAAIAAAIPGWQARETAPLVVAIDGYGASGKTTIAGEVASELDALTVHTDEYYEVRDPAGDPHPMARYYRWEALRRWALEPGIAQRVPLILVEGVSSGSPALADLVTRTVFVDTPEAVRLERLHSRIAEEEWDEEWLAAERAYFANRPPASFDLIVPGVA